LNYSVSFVEVKSDYATKAHAKRLYYFSDKKHYLQIANKIIKSIQDIETLYPYENKDFKPKNISFAIWII